MTSSNGADQRKFPRKNFRVRVEIRDHIRGRTTRGMAKDINPMGLLLETRRQFRVGETVSLVFPAPSGDYNLRVSGEVLRADSSGLTTRSGEVAVEFFDLEDWIFEELCNYVYDQKGAPVLEVAIGGVSIAL